MPKQLSRRQVLQLGLLTGVAAACSPTATPTPASTATRLAATPQLVQPTATLAPAVATTAPSTAATAAATATQSADAALIQNIAQAAQVFLGGLDDGQRAKATYAFDDAERWRWHWTTPGNFPRNGLPLREMTEAQKTLAHSLLQTSMSSAGYEKSLNIMALQNDLGNDPERYFVTMFGAPGERVWGWRWEGHHLSRQFTIVDDQIAMTPFFLGAWPILSSTGLRAMSREEDAALELATSLGQPAIFQANTLTRHITQNEARVGPLDPVGVAYGNLTTTQQQLALEIIQTYLSVLPDSIAAAQLERLTAAGLENIHFGWAGPLELRRPTYYRLQGPTFLLEHDKSRNGGTHIHSVWRDFERDFGYHLLA
ncbi:MAG: DUF3500 domain-containing protein [Anaerolineales bacterium]